MHPFKLNIACQEPVFVKAGIVVIQTAYGDQGAHESD